MSYADFYVLYLNGHKTKQTICLLVYDKTDRTLIENWQESEWMNERTERSEGRELHEI